MKKLLLFAAALAFGMAASAQLTGFDGRKGDLGKQIHDEELIEDVVNITMEETDAEAHKYNINITTGGECSFSMGGVEFWYSNSNDGTTAYKTYGTYIQPNGNKRKVTIPCGAGNSVRIYVQDAVAGVAVEGATVSTIDLVAWGAGKDQYTTLTAGSDGEIVIWSDDRTESYTAKKFKLGAIIPEAPVAIDNVAAAKAYKVVENGQLIIIKNGVRYNALGAKL